MLILTLIGYYLLAGCAFGVGFFVWGYAAIAPEAQGASLIVRLMWVPAAVVLWPLLGWKWVARR